MDKGGHGGARDLDNKHLQWWKKWQKECLVLYKSAQTKITHVTNWTKTTLEKHEVILDVPRAQVNQEPWHSRSSSRFVCKQVARKMGVQYISKFLPEYYNTLHEVCSSGSNAILHSTYRTDNKESVMLVPFWQSSLSVASFQEMLYDWSTRRISNHNLYNIIMQTKCVV